MDQHVATKHPADLREIARDGDVRSPRLQLSPELPDVRRDPARAQSRTACTAASAGIGSCPDHVPS